jgi:phage terminase large subunit
MSSAEIVFNVRAYQEPVIDYFLDGGKRAFEVWHRRAGKDRVATYIESALACSRVGLYWHALPEYAHARRVIWDAITKDGQKLIDVNFPPAIVKKRNDQEMKLELYNGSIWQLVGADNFNSLVGANPVHVTLSEYALMSPVAWEFIRPILAENGGAALFITTPRGYNHAYDLFQSAKESPLWHTSHLTVDDTGIISSEILNEERRTMPDELFRQEYYCDWSAANVGAILGRYLEDAEKSGRIDDEHEHDPEMPVYVSSDIGFHDTSAWWYWQPRPDGFAVIDYDEDSGLDAEEWIPRIEAKGYDYKTIYLPHDAKAKTFQSRHSAVEKFVRAFGADHVKIVPQSTKSDRINAARVVMRSCRFHRTRCAKGLNGLRAWSFKWDEDKRMFSKEPAHDWASHPGDGFSYGAQVMKELVVAKPEKKVMRDVTNTPFSTLWPLDRPIHRYQRI